MPTVTPAMIFGDVRRTLLDVGENAWTDDDMFEYLNDALRATANAKPDMYTKEVDRELVAGTEQTIPDDGIQLFDIYFNVDGDDTVGSGTGKVVTLADRELIDEVNRFWPTEDSTEGGGASDIVDHFYIDTRNPTRFTVSPPNDGDGEVRIFYGALPTVIGEYELGEEMEISDKFKPTLVYYMLFRAYGKNSKRQDITKSDFYYKLWASNVGVSTQAIRAMAPKDPSTVPKS